jgi:hypothetical protein
VRGYDPVVLQRYVLDDEGNPVRQDNPAEWKAFMLNVERRRVAVDEAGKWTVTTLFTGIDHDLLGNGPPVLWKTSVYGPQPWGGFSCWYSNRWRALSQHDQVAEAVRRGRDLPERPFPGR